jgi:superfamily II DNA or RNA helicase
MLVTRHELLSADAGAEKAKFLRSGGCALASRQQPAMTARAAAIAAGFADRPAPVLRPYQTECVDALRRAYAAGRRAPLLQLPTGGGKTIILSEVAHGARAKGRRVPSWCTGAS